MVLDKNKVLSVIGLDPNVEVVLPPKLSAYKHSNYIEQGRAKMLNQFITLAQILFAAVIPMQLMEYLLTGRTVELYYIVMASLAVCSMQYIRLVLRGGSLRVASNMVAIATMIFSWFGMFVERDASFSVLNNLFYIYVAMFILPLVIPNRRTGYVVVGINVTLMFLFWMVYSDDVAAMGSAGLDTIMDFLFSQIEASVLVIYAHTHYEQELKNHNKFVSNLGNLRKTLEVQTLRYSQFLDSFPEIIFSIDTEGNITYINAAAYAVLGIDNTASLDKHNVFEMLSDRDRYRLQRSLQRNQAGKISMGTDYAINLNGERRYFKFYISRMIEDGVCVGAEGMALDIAYQKAMEHELKHREELVHLISNETPNIILISNRAGELEMANRAFYRAELVQSDSVEGQHLSDYNLTSRFASPEFLSDIFEKGYLHTVNQKIEREGDTRYFECSCQPIWSASHPLLLITMVDITVQYRAIEQLTARKQEVERMMQALPNLVVLSDENDKLLWCNEALLNMFNIPADKMETIVGQSMYNFIDVPTGREQFWEAIRKSGILRNHEMDFKDKWGNNHQFIVSASQIDYGGRSVVLTSMIDAYEVKRGERMFNDMLAAMPNMVSIVDKNLTIRWANQAFCDFLELSTNDLCGKNIFNIVREGSIKTTEGGTTAIVERLLGNGFIKSLGIQCEDRNGRSYSAVLSGSIIRYEDQEMFLFVVVDTSERDRLQQELHRAENSMLSVLNSIPNMVLVVDFKKHVRWANEGMCAFMGCTLEEAIGRHMYDIAPPDSVQPSDKIWGGLKNDGYIRNLPVIYKNRAGHTHSGLASAVPIEMDGDLCVVALVVDTTEHDELEAELSSYRETLEIQVAERTDALQSTNEELISTNEALIESNRLLEIRNSELQETMDALKEAQNQLIQSEKMSSLGLLASGIAHEINNPLNYIRGGIQGIENLIDEGVLAESPEIKLLVGAVHEGINRAATIVKGMGRYSRSSERVDEHCDLHSILGSCVVLLHSQLKGNVKLSRHFSAEKLEVLGNEGKLHQVFVNIIQNAIHAVGNAGKIDIETYRTGKYVVVQVRDTGVGISDDVLAHIFDPFFTTKPPGQGTGLGLAISQKIIVEHGGKIDVTSQQGQGTTVSVHLPLILDKPE